MKIEMIEPIKLTPADYNPRDISDKAFEGLKQSIITFGFVDPIIVNRSSGNIVGGHQRLKAAFDLNLDKVPVVYVELDETKELALNVALNNTKTMGFYTDELQDILKQLSASFSMQDLDALRFSDLLTDTNWHSNLDVIERTEETVEPMAAQVIVKCPKDIRTEVVSFLRIQFSNSAFRDITVE